MFIYLQQLYLTWRKSIRSYDKFTAEVQRMTWMTSTRTTVYGVYSWTSLSKLQFILVETFWRIYDLPRINSWCLWNSYSKWLENWSRIRQTSVVWPPLITKNLRGDRRLYYVTKRLGLRMSKPTSSPTRCSVCEVWVTNQSKPGRTKLNGIWKIAISKIWIESMESRWSSSGKYSQDSLHWAFLKRFNNIWQNESVNLSSSHSHHLLVNVQRLYMGTDEEWQEKVRWILLQLRIMLADSCSDVGHFWELDQRRHFTEIILINQMETGTRLLNEGCSTLQKAVIIYFVPPAPLKRGELRSKAKGKKSIHFNGSEENIELILHTIISVNQLSVYGAVADLCKELSNDSEVAGKPAANEDLEPMEIPTELPTADPHTNARLEGNLMRDYEHKFEQLPENQKLSKLYCDAGLKIVEKGQFFIT